MNDDLERDLWRAVRDEEPVEVDRSAIVVDDPILIDMFSKGEQMLDDEFTVRDVIQTFGGDYTNAYRKMDALVREGKYTMREAYDPRAKKSVRVFRKVKDEG